MSAVKKKIHSLEFKAKASLEVLRGTKTIKEISQEYSVHPVQYRFGNGRRL